MDLNQYLVYTDKNGAITDRSDRHRSPNGARLTAEYLQGLVAHNKLNPILIRRLKDTFRKFEIAPGLTVKVPHIRDHGYDSIDNMVAILYADFILNIGYAARLLEYGFKTKTNSYDDSKWNKHSSFYQKLFYKMFKPFTFNFNNQYPLAWSWSTWYGRMLQLKAMAKMVKAHHEKKKPSLNILESIVWIYAVSGGAKDKHTDSKVLSGFLVHVARGMKMFTGTCNTWEKNYKKVFLNGHGEALNNYLRDKRHPLIKDLWGYF